MSKNENAATPKKCQKNAAGIIWLINQKLNTETESVASSKATTKPHTTSEAVPSSNNTDKEKHFMISYNRESRELCLKIKRDLESQNLKVWIDIDSISGSSLQSMASAIENSVCVLMCMTEQYKHSNYCRAEAEYAFQLNKPIIPLIMQKDYKPGKFAKTLERPYNFAYNVKFLATIFY